MPALGVEPADFGPVVGGCAAAVLAQRAERPVCGGFARSRSSRRRRRRMKVGVRRRGYRRSLPQTTRYMLTPFLALRCWTLLVQLCCSSSEVHKAQCGAERRALSHGSYGFQNGRDDALLASTPSRLFSPLVFSPLVFPSIISL